MAKVVRLSTLGSDDVWVLDGRVVSRRIIETPQLKLGELLIVATMTLSRVAFYAFLVGEEIL